MLFSSLSLCMFVFACCLKIKGLADTNVALTERRNWSCVIMMWGPLRGGKARRRQQRQVAWLKRGPGDNNNNTRDNPEKRSRIVKASAKIGKCTERDCGLGPIQRNAFLPPSEENRSLCVIDADLGEIFTLCARPWDVCVCMNF